MSGRRVLIGYANKAFRATLKDKTPEERKPLIQQHRTQQETENKAFDAEQHAKAIAHVQSSNKTDAQKAEIIKNLQERWAKEDAKRAERKDEWQGEHNGKGGKNK